jgi:preprotein translocase subunit YajC
MMHLNEILVLAQAAVPTAAPAGTSAGTPGALPQQSLGQALFNEAPFLVLIFIIFYFIFIRPQSLQRKQQAKLLEALKSGDRVITASGIVGVVISVKDKAVPPSVSLRSADMKMEVTKSSVVQILEGSAAAES